MLRIIFIAILCCGTLFAAYFLAQPSRADVQGSIAVSDALGSNASIDDAYKRVLAPRPFVFPQDHAPHDDYKTEWWYFTGNLQTRTGRRFGYQLTFFRTALAPNIAPDSLPKNINNNTWKARQIFMAHFTITDVETEKFYSFEKFSRVANGLAGCKLDSTPHFRVWLHDWSASSDANKPQNSSIFPLRLRAVEQGVELDLLLDSIKPVVLQGDKGLSAKSEDAGNASYYYSLTRLKTQGIVRLADGDSAQVTGTSWFDREWSTSALSKQQVGWDWFALHFDDGREFMFYQIRNKNGQSDPTSKGVLVAQNGSSTTIFRREVILTPEGSWKSPQGGEYPATWNIRLPAQNMEFRLTPLVQNQELNVSVRYWEGAVKIAGKQGNTVLSGYGYVEMTGYADVRKQSAEK
ncbi:MAG: carotenoid 1,2-hydratase [Candidatus Kapaibacterium sp.]|nr:MAG: carotenoid 1,2-hydratase [Candidatus Kapabacteria bacterium]